MKKKNGTGHSTKQLYSALFFINCVHFIDYSPFLYSNSPHSPPSLFHPMFSFLQNQTTCTAQKYLFSKIQNQKIPLSFPNAARPSQNHHLLFPPTKKINAHPASPKTPSFQNFRLFHFPAEFSQFTFPPHPFSPQKQKKDKSFRIYPF